MGGHRTTCVVRVVTEQPVWCGWSQNNLCGEGGHRTSCVVWVVTEQPVMTNTWCVISMLTHKLLPVRAGGGGGFTKYINVPASMGGGECMVSSADV